MTLDEARQAIEAYRTEADEFAKGQKDPFISIERLRTYYRSLAPAERNLTDKVLSEWVLSDDGARRFDGLSLVDEFGIFEAQPALQLLAARLTRDTGPGAKYELKKVSRILASHSGGTR
jgi:hypothetical protein